MAIRGLKKLFSSDQVLNRIQDELLAYTKQLNKLPILNGVLLEDVAITSGGPVIIEHKLGREYIGWIVVKASAQGDLFESTTANNQKHRQLLLESNDDFTVSLWVF